MNNTSFTEQDYEQMGRATFRSAINSLQEQLPQLRKKANTNKFDGLKGAIEQAYRKKKERRTQTTQPGTRLKPKTAVQPATAKTSPTKKNNINWELINNIPHNRYTDNATY